MKARILFLITAALSLFAVTAWGQLYWNTNESPAAWTAANWSTSSSGPFTTAWTDNTNAIFSAASTVTFATASIGDVTVNDGLTVTITQAGTLSTNNLVRTFNIGTGSTLTWTTQNVSSGSSSGFIKSGSGIWNIGAQGNPYTGGFTLNAGTVIVSGNNSFGTAALTINGGTIQSSGTRSFAPTSIVIGGDFTITGTGTPTFSGTVALGSAIRTITNDYNSNNNAITFSGIISNSSGGISFAATAGAVTAGSTIAITNNANSYTGITNITGGEVTFPADRCFGASPGSVTANSIVVDGGRLTLNPPASTNYTLDANRGIQVGATANTAISVKTGTSVTYNGVIADKPSTIGAWAKQGGAIFILGGVSTYSGATSINNGTVQLSSGSNRLPTGTTLNLGQAPTSTNLGTFDLNGNNQEIAGLVSTTGINSTTSNNTVTSSSAATLTISGSGTYSYGAGTAANSGIISGSISLVKTGSGTQTLGDANTYTGLTTVSGGTLQLSCSGGNTIPATNNIVINNGGTLKVSSNQTVNNLTLNSGGTLTIDGGVTLNVTGSYTNNGGTVNNGGTLLPVEMTSFTAVAQKTSALLAWSTATEVNNYGFEVERSGISNTGLGTMNWQKFGFVNGAGTSNARHEYSFTDKNVPPGRYMYRLKQIDRDGSFEYSQSVEVEVGTVPHVFSLSQNYPDPFNPTTTINYSLPSDEKVRLAVYDILGNEVGVLVNGEQTAGSHQAAFSGANLASGIYFYKLESSGQTIIKKMILLK